ncbi:MAG: RidA family protein [Alphaproteobacteria bacterium]
MNRSFNPSGISAPLGAYHHGVEVPAGARWLHASGQVGITPDGKVAEGFEAQATAAMNNLTAILKEAGMEWTDVVKLNSFITNPADIAALRKVRGPIMGDAKPASTLLVVAGLASPDLLVEIELIAAKS